MYCSQCGMKLAEGSNFCHKCGRQIKKKIAKQEASEDQASQKISDEWRCFNCDHINPANSDICIECSIPRDVISKESHVLQEQQEKDKTQLTTSVKQEESESVSRRLPTQIQCPNCGSYDIEVIIPNIVESLLVLAGFALWIIPGFLLMGSFNKRDWQRFFDGKNPATCKICRFSFWIHQVPVEPIPPNVRLIQTGRQRLREEEEKRRRYHYDD